MRIPVGELECPRGHNRQPLLLTVRSISGQPVIPGGDADHVTIPVWSQRDLDRRLASIAENPDLEAFIRPAELPQAEPEESEQLTGGDTENMPTGNDLDTGGGESYTHGQWQQSTARLHQAVAELGPALDDMLSSLTAADAGKTQFAGVMDIHDRAAAWADQVRTMFTDVNARELPVVDAVGAAGGPDDINKITYYEEV
jgi:hypothetical protein